MKRIILLLCCLLPASSFAVPAGDFYDRCNKASQKQKEGQNIKVTAQQLLTAGSCIGYISGTLNGINLVSGMMLQQKLINKNLICAASNTTPQRLYTDVMTLLKENEEARKLPVEAVVFRLFTEKYPCPNPQ